MTANARDALRHLTTAFEDHIEAIATRRGPNDAAVDDAYDVLAESFERYEDALDVEFAESVPMVLDDADDDGGEGDRGEFIDDDDESEDIDAHAEEDEDQLDDDIVEFDLKS